MPVSGDAGRRGQEAHDLPGADHDRWAGSDSSLPGRAKIASATGLDRKAVGCYVEVVEALPLPRGRAATDEEIAEVAWRVQSRPLVPTTDERAEVGRYRKEIEGWLEAKPQPRLTRI